MCKIQAQYPLCERGRAVSTLHYVLMQFQGRLNRVGNGQTLDITLRKNYLRERKRDYAAHVALDESRLASLTKIVIMVTSLSFMRTLASRVLIPSLDDLEHRMSATHNYRYVQICAWLVVLYWCHEQTKNIMHRRTHDERASQNWKKFVNVVHWTSVSLWIALWFGVLG